MRGSVISALGLMILTATMALGYGGEAHSLITRKSLEVLAETDRDAYDCYLGLDGRCSEIRELRAREASFYQLSLPEMLIAETPAVDEYRDIEFVDVQGGFGDGGRDDPHKTETTAINDIASTGRGSMSFTAFNHFIDIRKGPGVFDDYDGYSYRRGSGSKDEHQKASLVASSWGEKLAGDVTGFKVDEGVNWWFNDEYVHVAGHKWYKGCSPAMERYSFFQEKGLYKTKEAELTARFPLANSTGSANRGIPYSIFMPVDNMARYWYERFVDTGDVLALGPVMHAIQDASVPHHAAGCLGNWHSQYEDEVDSRIPGWLDRAEFAKGVKGLVAEWSRPDPSPPSNLKPDDYSRTPSIDWRVDQLVTWVALNAFREYAETYDGFKNGYRLNEKSAVRLGTLATAMSVLVLKKASAEQLTEEHGKVKSTDAVAEME